MIYGAKQLADSFRTVRKNTILIAEDIPEEKYSFAPAEGLRTVAGNLTHIAQATELFQDLHASGLTTFAGYDFGAVFQKWAADEATPRTKAQIVERLRTTGDSFAAWLESRTDEFLAETVTDGMGGSKTRLEGLMSAKEHEMHHRGQLMLIERLIGIVPHLTRRMQEQMSQAAQK
jgi:uncharacterized damage-inducible protein DinB